MASNAHIRDGQQQQQQSVDLVCDLLRHAERFVQKE